MSSPATTSDRKAARLAGVLYLILLPTTGLWYGVGQSFLTGDAGAMFGRIQAGRTLFETALVAGAVGFVDFLILGVVLYRLFSPVGKSAASLLLAFVAVSASVSLVAVARQIDVLWWLDWGQRLPALGGDQAALQVALTMRSADNLFLVTDIFSGLWLLPLAWLGFRSGVLPRALAVLLVFGGFFYLSTFVGTVLTAGYASTLVARTVGIVFGVPGVGAELATALWLSIKGARVGVYETATVAAAHPAASLSER